MKNDLDYGKVRESSKVAFENAQRCTKEGFRIRLESDVSDDPIFREYFAHIK